MRRLSCSCNVFEALYVLNTLAVNPSINVCKCLFMIAVWSNNNENINVNTWYHRYNCLRRRMIPCRRDPSLMFSAMDVRMLMGKVVIAWFEWPIEQYLPSTIAKAKITSFSYGLLGNALFIHWTAKIRNPERFKGDRNETETKTVVQYPMASVSTSVSV